MPRPLCFMVMPYGRKPTQVEQGKGPGDIDFNALWDKAYVPVIEELGYEPIRADQDTGALIITQMLERLYFADLVLADMTIPNGNVYYELGIRHAARDRGCVLLAADWSKRLFDVAQLRTVTYPLPEGNIEATTAAGIQKAIKESIRALAKGRSPMHEAIKGYPDRVDESAATTMQEYLRDLAAMQGEIRSVRALSFTQRMSRAKALADKYAPLSQRAPVAIALVRLLRESVGASNDWSIVLDYIAALPSDIADQAEFYEHRAFALSGLGRIVEAIAELETAMTRFGPTPERLGILGGRFKRLAQDTTVDARQRIQFQNQAIDAYERGMNLDLNEYYCSSNLPRLYRSRNAKGDEERAQTVLRQVIMACDRAISRGTTDTWLRATLLNAAFDAGDADKAEAISEEMSRVADDSGLAALASYKLDIIINDLDKSSHHVSDPEKRGRLEDVVAKFRNYLPSATG
jgi:tetratricopeptide (TPR) repeat protein